MRRRLFVAIRPPEEIRALLLGRMGGIGGARWQRDDQLHLTLRFIGEVDRHRARDIDAALAAVHHPAFAIALDGIGLFDRRGRPEAIWAGACPRAPLERLNNKVEQALVRVGLAPETRAYLPHITLARLNRHAGPVRDFVTAAGGLSSPPFPVRAFGLFESTRSPGGSLYTELARYTLD
jgi:2'-5' RNA ligase